MEFQTQTFLTGSSLKIVFYINENGFGVILGYPGPRPLPLPLPLPLRHHFPLAPVFRPPHDLPLGIRGCFGVRTSQSSAIKQARLQSFSAMCSPHRGKHISLRDMCSGEHISLGNTYHCDTGTKILPSRGASPKNRRVAAAIPLISC